MMADTLYGGDENVQAAETSGVELVAHPRLRAGNRPAALTLDDSTWTNGPGVGACLQGHEPLVVERDKEAGTGIELAGGMRGKISATPARSTRLGRPQHLGIHRQGPSLAERRREQRPGVRSGTAARASSRPTAAEESAEIEAVEGTGTVA